MEKKLILLLSSGSVVDFVSSSFEADFCSLKMPFHVLKELKFSNKAQPKKLLPKKIRGGLVVFRVSGTVCETRNKKLIY